MNIGASNLAFSPPGLQDELFRELEPGERIVWIARPSPKAFAKNGWILALFGIPFTAFAIFWMAMAGVGTWKMEGGFKLVPGCFSLFGVPFVMVGLWMLTSPFWLRRQAGRTMYAITDRRAITRTSSVLGKSTVRSYRSDGLGSITRTERADGSGDLVFEESITGYGKNRRVERRGFIGLADVRDAEAALNRTLLNRRS